MKPLALIIALIFSSLILLPCADAAGHSCAEKAHTDCAGHDTEHEQEHSHEADGCSPLCICQCCQSHLPTIQLAATDIPLPNMADFAELHSGAYSPHLPNIWQPPRL